MATLELRQQNLTTDELAELARSLAALASEAMDRPSALEQMARGFLELSSLASRMGRKRACMASRAMASILAGLDRRPADDAAFILGLAIDFLETIGTAGTRRPSLAGA
ncbi:MAG: hypothetical protein JWP91_1141 [Fibrobacteres bacterium]|nr:hypothetical protein [Fibrobacterota bacterium]